MKNTILYLMLFLYFAAGVLGLGIALSLIHLMIFINAL